MFGYSFVFKFENASLTDNGEPEENVTDGGAVDCLRFGRDGKSGRQELLRS